MMKRRMILGVAALLAAAVGGSVWVWSCSGKQAPKQHFQTETVTKMDLVRSISATGTVEPEELVNVGAQVNGKIVRFGTDLDGKPMDYGSRVKAGMVLAQIDDVAYQAELAESKASVAQAEASVESAAAEIQSARANLESARTRLTLADRNWERAKVLYPKKVMNKSEYDSYESAFLTAKSDVSVAVANLSIANAKASSAKASLQSAKAQLVKAQRNVDYCVITTPVDGIVIDRRVSIGQTVVSNQTASSIFLVAKDFARMQVWVSVNEADIGSVKVGMKVLFSVDAFPGREFEGKVSRIRMNATLSSNVVTYIVEVNTDNSDRKLIPYLTANVKFIRSERRGVPALSNGAFRFVPDPALIDHRFEPAVVQEKERVVWVKTPAGKLRSLAVKTGLNNGLYSEILSPEPALGSEVVTGVTMAAEAAPKEGDGSVNPFMPKFPKRPASRARQGQGTGGAGQPPKGR